MFYLLGTQTTCPALQQRDSMIQSTGFCLCDITAWRSGTLANKDGISSLGPFTTKIARSFFDARFVLESHLATWLMSK